MKHGFVSFLLAVLVCAPAFADDARPIRVVVWDERQPEQKHAYDGGFLGDHIAKELAKRPGLEVRSVGLDDPDQGLSDATLDNCDVLLWWAHVRHGEISQDTARRVVDRVLGGKLALVPIHSALSSRPFISAMRERAQIEAIIRASAAGAKNSIRIDIVDPGPEPVRKGDDVITPEYTILSSPNASNVIIKLTWPACSIGAWREDGKPSHVTVRAPDHPIMKGLPKTFDIPQTEMYDEPFQVPEPDLVLFEERWDAGEHFRGGCLWHVGKGDVFYFRPGHETYPVFKNKEPMQILENAARWLGKRVQDQSKLGG